MVIKKKYKYAGWDNNIRLTNGKIELIVTTDIGPRIIRFGFIGGNNIFKEYEDQIGKEGGNEWRIYGGHRLWHAPESFPRTYFPDNKPVDFYIDKKFIKLVQKTEETTGIQKSIEIIIDDVDNSVFVTHRLKNNNLWEIELSPWSPTVLVQKGRVIIPQEPYKSHKDSLLPVRPLVLWSYTNMNDERFIWGEKYIQIKQDPSATTEQKIGVLNTLGWAGYYIDKVLFLKLYDYKPFTKYPHFDCNTEIFTNSEMIELETSGEMRKIPPEGSTEHIERWYLFKLEISEDEKSIDKNIIPIIHKLKEKNKYNKLKGGEILAGD